MPTQEERLTILEYDLKQYKTETIKAYGEMAIEMIMVKGLVEDAVTTPYGYKPRASGMTPVCRPIPIVRFMPMSEAKLKTTHALHGTICSHGSVFTSGPSPENPYTI